MIIMVSYALTFVNNICRYLQMSADICADIWSRQQISGHAAKTHNIGININHR
jgi:hypothetical protein